MVVSQPDGPSTETPTQAWVLVTALYRTRTGAKTPGGWLTLGTHTTSPASSSTIGIRKVTISTKVIVDIGKSDIMKTYV